MLANRPLFPTLADARYYVWTAAAREFRDAVLLGRNTLVLGQRGAGKTSMLHMLAQSLREQDARPVAFVSFAGIVDPAAAVRALHDAARDAEWVPPLGDNTLRALDDRGDAFAPTAILRRLRFCPPRSVLLVDDVGAEIGGALFGRLRDELWQLPPSWAVATIPDEAGPLLTPPAEAFFERRVVVGELDPEERYEILRRRTKRGADRLPADAARTIARAGTGNPRELISLARDVRDRGITAEDVAVAKDRRRITAEGAAGPVAAGVIAEMEGLGPVSAADPRLLDRLGWDRPRLARTLSRLEDAGVVQSYLEPREGRIGRPRKLYDLKPLTDFLP